MLPVTLGSMKNFSDGYHQFYWDLHKNTWNALTGKASFEIPKVNLKNGSNGYPINLGTGPSSPLFPIGSGAGSGSGSGAGGSGSGSGSSGGDYYSSAKSLEYKNADLAEHYGMNASTAYQEALANTAYQRSVLDMQAAGLNPSALYGAGRANPAQGVAYASPLFSGSGSYSRSGSGNSSLFSTSAYGAVTNLAGLAGLAVSKGKYTGYLAGTTAAKGIMGLLDVIF